MLSRLSGAWLREVIEQRYYRPVLDHELRHPSARFLRRGDISRGLEIVLRHHQVQEFLDRVSLELKRPVTLPLVKEALKDMEE